MQGKFLNSRHSIVSLKLYDLLVEQFIPSCAPDSESNAALGLVVGLRRYRCATDGATSLPFVVVGQCACVQLQTPSADLVKFGLPTPDWTATRETVARHFPAGCEGCGVWVRMVEGCSREPVQELMDVLHKITDLQVRGTFHTDLQP